MKIFARAIFIIFSVIFLLYLVLPGPFFPSRLPNSVESKEAGDHETPLRRGYYTNLTRGEVLTDYQAKFSNSPFYNLPLPTYRLNYPPEEAQTLVHDQTRSTFLEEIVHPFRESLFVNGFEPKLEKDILGQDGKIYRQKITVRYVESSLPTRISIGILTLGLLYVIAKEWENA